MRLLVASAMTQKIGLHLLLKFALYLKEKNKRIGNNGLQTANQEPLCQHLLKNMEVHLMTLK